MTSDDRGNDILRVGKPIDEQVYFARTSVARLTLTDVKNEAFVPGVGWYPSGLQPTDGGAQVTLEPNGDYTEYLQDGYKTITGLANASIVYTIAERDPVKLALLKTGKLPDEDNLYVVDAAGSLATFQVFIRRLYLNGDIEQIWAPNALSKVVEKKTERGTDQTNEITFTINRDSTLKGHVAICDIVVDES